MKLVAQVTIRRSFFHILLAAIGFMAVFGGAPTAAQTGAAPTEIVELARALKNDPDLIYEYVYNNVETLPQYGSSKGALGALLDGKGTAFDQAELMVALLQQAGYSASFQLGSIALSISQLSNWLGVDNSINSVEFTLGSGGFPAQVFGNPVLEVVVGWAWVSVDIGGTNYVFDPSTKVYNRSAGLGTSTIGAALGYSQSTFINDAESGATISPTTISGLNRTNIRNDLAKYSSNLVGYIRANNAAAGPSDIFGGKTIVPLPIGTHLRQTQLSYGQGATFPTIPSSYRTTLTLTLGSNDASNNFTALSGSITFNTSDIYNHRLIISFDASSVPSLLLDGVPQLVASGAVPSGRQLTVRTSISHPYPTDFANVTNSDVVRMTPFTNFIYLIETGWGLVGQGTIEKHRKLLQDNIAANPGNPTAEPVLGESLAMIGYTWLAELAQQQQLVDQLAGTNTIFHHAVGVVGIKAVGSSSGPYVDLPINLLSIIQRSARSSSTTETPVESSAFFSEATFASIAESGILEQTQPGAVAASTVKLIDTAVAANGTIYDINNSAVPDGNPAYYASTIRPVLATTYGAGDLARIDNLVNSQNLRVIAPANGAITVNQYTGAGYFQIAQDGTSIGSIITGGLSGGEPASPVPTDQIPDNTSQSAAPAPAQNSGITQASGSLQGNAGGNQGVTPVSAEPINLVTGDYLNNATDLTIGSQPMPYGLAFQRYYDSGTRAQKGVLGGGWTHNFSITASIDSDGFAGLAANSPISGASAIAATFVALDILNNGTTTAKPLDRVVITSVLQRWLMDQLTGNIVAVLQPGYLEHFTKLADGTYNPPPGSATTLSLNAGAFKYVTKTGETLSFDASGNLQSWTKPSGATITLAYSGSPELLTTVTNNLGRTLALSYTSGLLTHVSDGNGRSVSYGYDASSNLTSFTDLLGHVTTYAYDQPGRLIQIFYPANPTTPFVTNSYDSFGRIRTQAGGANAPWQYFFAGARSEEDDPFGTQHVIYSTPRGKTRSEIRDLQGLDLVTTNTFDALDRLISTTFPEGVAISYTYDTNSNVLTVTSTPKSGSPLSPLVTTYSYDPVYNKPTKIVEPLGLITTTAYDGATGNLVQSIADAGGSPHLNARSSFTYNDVGQPLTASDPLGTVTQFGYDRFGNQTSIIRDAGAGRLNQATSLSYNPQGDVVSLRDPNGNITTSTYDAARRLATTTSPPTPAAPIGLVTAFAYDPNGQLVQTRQSAPGGTVLRSTSATYTLTGKTATVTDANNNPPARYSYDALDRVASVTDPMGRVTSYGYDALSRQVSISNPAIQASPLLQKTYTLDGLLASLTDANSHTTSFGYDGFDRLATTTYPLGSTEAFTYDADNNVLTRQTRAGQTITFTYDTLNRLATKTPPAPAPVVTYGYDLAGHLTSVSDTSAAIAAAVPPSGASVQYGTSLSYDATNRPIGVSWSPAPAAAAPTASSVTFGHTYNAVNQRIGQSISDNSWVNYPAATASRVSYTANALNQYTAVGSVSPTYDGNGNLTSDGTFTFGYDAENRLTSASGAGNTASYTFDAQGRRKTRTVNGTTTVFVTDADNREVLEYDGTSGAIQRWYAYNLGPNDVLNQTNVVTATRAALVPDIQGSIIAALDSGSGVLSKLGYLPYGKSASAGPFGYTGQRVDVEMGGLYYYRARHYSPAWGRFLQADPIGYRGGIHLYAYVRNDPLNLIDPSGLVLDQIGSAVSSAGTFALDHPGQVLGAGLIGAGIVACTLTPCVALEVTAGGLAAGGATLTTAGVVAGDAIVGGASIAALDISSSQNNSNQGSGSVGGRLGGAATRAQNAGIASDLESQGYTITGGGGRLPEEYIPGAGPGTRGSTYVDITAQNSATGQTLRVQTIDTLANGNPTAREAAAQARIQSAFPNDALRLVPKQ